MLKVSYSQLRPALLGGVSAFLFLSSLIGLMPAFILTFAAPFPLFILGLREGIRPLRDGLLVGALGCTLWVGVVAAFFYLALVALPVFLLVVAALQSQKSEAKRVTSLVLVLQLYGLLLATGLLVVLLKVLDVAAIQEALMLVLTTYKIPFNQEMLKTFYLLMPGGYAALTMTILFFNGIAAQQILKGQGNALMAMPDLRALDLPFWPWVALVVSGIVAFTFPQTLWGIYGRNVLLVLHVLFLLQGLSVAHAYAKTKPYGKVFLVSLYFFTFAIDWLGWLRLLIAGLGAVEPWLKLRQRFISQKRGDH